MVYPKTTMAHRISSEVQSVTSNSKSSEEESSHGGGEADSSDDDARRADASVLQRRTLDEAMTRAVESESEAAASSTSREPQPVQGGSDEVVRLSHVASIEVRQDVSMDPPRSSASDVHRKRNSNGRTMSPVPEAMERSGSGGSRDGKARFLGPISGAARNRAGSASAEDAAAEDDSVATSDCAPMDLIDKSPYEPSLNAEKGIKVFTDMKNLLAESHDDNLRSVDPKAAKIFGPTNAWCLVKANSLIDKSGMVYSQEWVNGSIRGNLIGKIPKELLLLCLVAKRFAKAGELLLAGLVRDLEVYNLVKEALKEWNLDDEFKRVAACPKNLVFLAKKRDCYKCEIFVARAYSCMKAFGIEKMDDDLLVKIRTCLEIMESRLPDTTGTMSQKKRKKPEEIMPPAPPPPPPEPTPPPKKRRGRPPKVRHELIIKQEEPAAGASHNSDSESTRDDALPRSVMSSVASSARPRRSFSNGNKSTLSAIVARFEQQHREMGEMYRQMGETLAALKSKIEESRESTEREIRSELLQEVQKTIMSSFPKK